MTQQRLSLLWTPLVLALTACGGGSGEIVDLPDPAAPPDTADQQPPIAGGNPASAIAAPPGARQPLPPDPNAPPSPVPPPPPDGGGGDCAALCNGIRAECEMPDEDCIMECNRDRREPCGAEGLALIACATEVLCLEEVAENLFSQVVIEHCPQELQIALACDADDED